MERALPQRTSRGLFAVKYPCKLPLVAPEGTDIVSVPKETDSVFLPPYDWPRGGVHPGRKSISSWTASMVPRYGFHFKAGPERSGM